MRASVGGRVLVALALVLGGALPMQGQAVPSPRPAFRVGVEVVNLTVSVIDGRNRYITGLREKDFAVFEDGVRQELSLFSQERLPISLALLIDTSASMEAKLPVARAAALRLLKTLRPRDLAQVVQFSDRPSVLQEFSSDTTALLSAVGKTVAAGPTALYTALYVTLKELDKQGRRGEARRRAIVLLSDGEDTSSVVGDEQVLELARSTEINVYTIGLRPESQTDRQRPSYRAGVHFLTALAHETGGQTHFPGSLSELDSVYDRIAEELRTQYTMGYVSSNTRRDGRWRRIVVQTPDRNNLQVRYKRGYYAPSG